MILEAFGRFSWSFSIRILQLSTLFAVSHTQWCIRILSLSLCLHTNGMFDNSLLLSAHIRSSTTWLLILSSTVVVLFDSSVYWAAKTWNHSVSVFLTIYVTNNLRTSLSRTFRQPSCSLSLWIMDTANSTIVIRTNHDKALCWSLFLESFVEMEQSWNNKISPF